MSKFLHKIKDAMTSNKAKSKRPSHGSESWDYGLQYDSSLTSGPSSRREYEPYGTGDYGSRFGSHGIKPRPGTYGSGEYGSNTGRHSGGYYGLPSDGRNHCSGTNGYAFSSSTGAYGFDSGVWTRRGVGDGERGSGYQNPGSYRYGLRDKMGSIPN